jgi:hypothetical protein
MASSRRNFLKGSLGMLAASAQQKNPLGRPQQTRNASARANLFPGFKPMRITTSGAERGNRPPAFRNAIDFWKEKAVDARGRSLPFGHFIAEEVPQETLAELRSFLTAS